MLLHIDILLVFLLLLFTINALIAHKLCVYTLPNLRQRNSNNNYGIATTPDSVAFVSTFKKKLCTIYFFTMFKLGVNKIRKYIDRRHLILLLLFSSRTSVCFVLFVLFFWDYLDFISCQYGI